MNMDKNLLLVRMVEKFPCLYKTDSMEYSKREFTDRAWVEVSKEINLSVSECKEKWKNIRYGFLRSLRPTRDGSSKKKYYMHNEMEFIIPYTKTSILKLRDKMPNYSEGDSDKEDHPNNDDNNENGIFVVPYVDDNSIDAVEEPLHKKTKTYYKCIELETNKGKDEDPRRMFLLSLLPEIEDFSESEMKIFRRRVFGLLDEINDNKYQIPKAEPL